MVLAVYAFIHFAWTQQHSTQNTENWKIKTIMFLQSAMWFAEMSELTDEPWWGQRGDRACHSPPAPSPTWVTGSPKRGVWAELLIPPCVSVPLLPPFSCTGIWVSVGKAVILMAMFWLGFLWLCSPKEGETQDKAFHKPRLCHPVPSAPHLTEKY